MTKIVGYHARITGLVISFVRRSSKALNKYIFWNKPYVEPSPPKSLNFNHPYLKNL